MPTTKTKRSARSGGGKEKSSAASITNYTTGLKWLYGHVDNESLRLVKYDDKAFPLNRMKQLLKLLGNPQDGLKCVHVAGTKGPMRLAPLMLNALAISRLPERPGLSATKRSTSSLLGR